MKTNGGSVITLGSSLPEWVQLPNLYEVMSIQAIRFSPNRTLPGSWNYRDVIHLLCFILCNLLLTLASEVAKASQACLNKHRFTRRWSNPSVNGNFSFMVISHGRNFSFTLSTQNKVILLVILLHMLQAIRQNTIYSQHVALQCYSIYLHLLFYSAHFHPL